MRVTGPVWTWLDGNRERERLTVWMASFKPAPLRRGTWCGSQSTVWLVCSQVCWVFVMDIQNTHGYIYIYDYIYTYMHSYKYIYIYIYIYMHTHIYMCISIYMFRERENLCIAVWHLRTPTLKNRRASIDFCTKCTYTLAFFLAWGWLQEHTECS